MNLQSYCRLQGHYLRDPREILLLADLKEQRNAPLDAEHGVRNRRLKLRSRR